MFNFSRSANYVAAFVFISFLAACSDVSKADAVATAKPQPAAAISLDVYKSPTCGCCSKWIDHIEQHGLQSTAHDSQQLSALKDKYKIPNNARSCHTAVSKDGYVFEGHVPAKFVLQFLQNPPVDAIGLTVPAMPLGSPGMEVDDKFMPYQIILLNHNGQHQVYQMVNSYEEQF
ncbi:DUF411 domain-containing protein [Thalassotalea sp. ND16A]|uniref:DUF411 domain-containing protein n=1 Tax=Thalassotalea sp. ND16A TaxID=1535422 RepID=UPI000519EDAC|nr:DUF411 domain-containing protein [Thalassotalea sp. ND16A]KGK00135.1 hypothetical protein ND16A_0326 [Thalassotalea sp. ND16A]